MKSARLGFVLGLCVASGIFASAVRAEEGSKALPTLLIKGEVVSVDTADQQAVLLKVRDRYGFETPIFVTADSKVLQGDAAIPVAQLATGNGVEVEYNFDVNTAKRQAVSVKVTQAKAAAPAVAPAVEPSEPAADAAATDPEAPAAAAPAADAPAATEAAPAAPAAE